MAESTAIAQAAQDVDLRQRIAALAALEHLGSHPTLWASDNQWWVAAEPGVADAYAYALNVGVQRPGWDLSVITDGALLAAVVAVANR